MRLFILPNFSRININMNNLRPTSKRLKLPRHTVIKPHPKRKQQITLINRIIRINRTMHPKHMKRQITRGRVRSEPHQSTRNRNTRKLDKPPQLIIRIQTPTTHIQNRPLRFPHQPNNLFQMPIILRLWHSRQITR
ncbi:hypothetical protein HanPI659440_Chr09g0355651 [Helianthus annuus]|nr:hypothetical protein HanPI659440_Chr09g0355651 [Helianthus annuus]